MKIHPRYYPALNRGFHLARFAPLLVACDSAPLDLPNQPAVQTERMVVYSTPAACSGTLVAWENLIDTVAESLRSSDQVESFAVILTDAPQVYCPDDASGCAKLKSLPMAAVGRAKSIPHEIAHVVEAQITEHYTIPAWREGFAEYWSGRGGALPRIALEDSIVAGDYRGVDYGAMRHFLGWALEVHGADAVSRLFRKSNSEDEPGARFRQIEDEFGVPWEDIQRDFWRTAPLYDPGPVECEEVAGTVDLSQPLVLDLPLACDRPDTYGPAPNHLNEGASRLATVRVVEVLEAGSYVVEVDRGTLLMIPCAPIDEPLAAGFWAAQDAAREEMKPLSSYVRRHTLDLQEGRFLAWAVAESYEPVTLTFSVYANRPRSRVAMIE